MTKRNPWKPVGRVVKMRDNPKLRVFPSGQGSLNNAARAFLFNGELSGYVRYERNGDDGRFSLVPVAKEMGLHVNKFGRVMLGPYAEHIGDNEGGFSITLRTDKEFGRRLVFDGIER